MAPDVWAVADAYESYVGRWSRRVAAEFVTWLDRPAGLRWLDVGCGTGALTRAILAAADPAGVVGVDPSEGFLAYARGSTPDRRATFQAGDARALPLPDATVDVAASALAVNFVPRPERAVAECARVTAPGGTVAAYVWDYAGGMAMLRHFWDAAVSLDPGAEPLHEGTRFPLCHPPALRALWTGAGLAGVDVHPIDVRTDFADFDAYWRPFLGGQGPAPGYVAALPEERRVALREAVRRRLPVAADGSIAMTARAWAVRGTVPD